MKKIISKLFPILCVGMIVFAILAGLYYAKEYADARKSYDKAESYTQLQEPEEETAGGEQEKEKNREKNQKGKPEPVLPKAPITVDFQSLRTVNPDVTGWLYVESADISYPILQGPDNDYYLHRTWEKKDNFAGSIFMDYRNAPNFSDYNTVLYGHNMKDGSMFHKIQYLMTEEYYAKSPYIWILTPDGDHRYKIFAEYDTRYDSDTYTFFWHPGKALEDYIKERQALSIWESEGTLQGDERILTLSTCNGATDIRRVVQAARE